ncbi:MAG: hypothetical protein HZA51_13085 [Planctomycetes bacterium]|nr:hypothetical protein [Planctomycetota bacterium]
MTFRRAILSLSLALAVVGYSSFVPSSFASSGWDGVNGSYDGAGTRGGNAGVVNITVPGLFNTTNARFIGKGGYTTLSGTAGGNGGVFQINYHGLVRNFTGGIPSPNGYLNFTFGGSTDGLNGSAGSIVYVKDSVCPRDADVTGEGRITVSDSGSIVNTYNNVTSDVSTFIDAYDINCDGIINVIDLARVGFEFGTR